MTEQDKDRIIEGLIKADHEKAVEILRLRACLHEVQGKYTALWHTYYGERVLAARGPGAGWYGLRMGNTWVLDDFRIRRN